MTRIMQAINGYYYVQEDHGYGYRRVGGFFATKTGARRWAKTVKYSNRSRMAPYVVEYV